MALDTICPHCKKKVILSYRIINPYLYGSKIRKCPKCGGDIFDNRWREVAIVYIFYVKLKGVFK